MTAKRDSIIFYRSFYEAICEFPPDIQAQVYSAIFEYSLNFQESVLDGIPKAIFTLIKPQLDANNRRYENGLKGGRKKQDETEEEPNRNQNETEEEPNDNDNKNDNVNEYNNLNDNDIKPKKFNFKQSLLDIGADESLVTDWLIVRKGKKASNTQHALNLFIKKVESSNLNINEVLSICIDKSWSGFELHWLENIKKNNTQQSQDYILKFEP